MYPSGISKVKEGSDFETFQRRQDARIGGVGFRRVWFEVVDWGLLWRTARGRYGRDGIGYELLRTEWSGLNRESRCNRGRIR